MYPIRQKYEALGMLVRWKDMMEKQIGRKIKELQIGNVKRYKNQFLQFSQKLVLRLTSQMEYMGWLRKSTVFC